MSTHPENATRDQVVALLALYGKWQRHAIGESGDPRSTRLNWASESIGRTVLSFADLTCDEARRLIDGLKASMGLELTRQPQPWRRIRSRERAQAAGTAGRKGASASLIQMTSPDDLARINEALRRLNWTRDRFEAWLRSGSSPIALKASGAILTVDEANKVWWALKAMLRRSGRWYPAPIRVCSRIPKQ